MPTLKINQEVDSFEVITTRFGCFELRSSVRGFSGLRLLPKKMQPGRKVSDAAKPVHEMLNDYFDGKEDQFRHLAIDLSALSSFQRRVLEELRKVPRGSVLSYGDLANRVGLQRGARAVATVMSHNPLPILIPCHRIILSSGRLGGYLMGSQWKKRLLAIEGILK